MGNHQNKANPFIKTGNVIVLTGASSGLGRNLALQLSKYQIRLLITGRNKDRLNQTKQLCLKNEAIAVEQFIGDLDSPQACQELIDFTIKKFARIDYLILNAGVNAHFNFSELRDITVYDKIMKTNFYANLYIVKYALPYLRKNRAHIVVISSMSGKLGLPERSAYCASKFALSGFFQSLRTQQQNISITQVYPTSLDTPMRDHDLMGHKIADKTSQNKQESAQKSAELIIQKIRPGQHDIYIPKKMYFGAILQPIFPNWMRNKVKMAAKL